MSLYIRVHNQNSDNTWTQLYFLFFIFYVFSTSPHLQKRNAMVERVEMCYRPPKIAKRPTNSHFVEPT